jgi:hypothetical protein
MMTTFGGRFAVELQESDVTELVLPCCFPVEETVLIFENSLILAAGTASVVRARAAKFTTRWNLSSACTFLWQINQINLWEQRWYNLMG